MPEQEKSVSEVFNQLRRQAEHEGITSDEFCEVLGLRRSTIAKIETGVRSLPKDVYFYEELTRISGIGFNGVEILLRAIDAPKILETAPDTMIPSTEFLRRLAEKQQEQ